MATKLYRWLCKQCNKSTNAPSKLGPKDRRRYCLDCSASSSNNKLVERMSPVLERKRFDNALAAKVKREKQVTRAHEREYVVNGIDCMKLAKQCAVLPVYGGRKGIPYKRLKSGALKLKIHRRGVLRGTTKGHCSRFEIYLGIMPTASEKDIRHIILHELMHLVVPSRWTGKKWNHHPGPFYRKLETAERQAERKLGAASTYVTEETRAAVSAARQTATYERFVKRVIKRGSEPSKELLERMAAKGSKLAAKLLRERALTHALVLC